MIWITFLTRIFDGSVSKVQVSTDFGCLQSFLIVSLSTVIEASLELCSLLTLLHLSEIITEELWE